MFKLYIFHHTQPLTALCLGLPWWASTRKVKTIWILQKQETVSGSGISWVICKSAPRSRQITMPAPHHSVFYRPDALPAAQPTASKHWRHHFKIFNNQHITEHQVIAVCNTFAITCRTNIKVAVNAGKVHLQFSITQRSNFQKPLTTQWIKNSGLRWLCRKAEDQVLAMLYWGFARPWWVQYWTLSAITHDRMLLKCTEITSCLWHHSGHLTP